MRICDPNDTDIGLRPDYTIRIYPTQNQM